MEKDRSTFTAYIAAVNDYKNIQRAYIKMKLLHPAAKHILCIYRIPGNRVYECEDYCDDNDHSCGKSVLWWMQRNKISCRMFFVVRNYGGKKLGASRHQCYIEAAERALENNPINAINGEHQTSTTTAAAKPKPHKQWANIKPQHTPSYRDSLSRQRDNKSRKSAQIRGNGWQLRTAPRRDVRTDLYQFQPPQNVLSTEEWPELAHEGNRMKHRARKSADAVHRNASF